MPKPKSTSSITGHAFAIDPDVPGPELRTETSQTIANHLLAEDAAATEAAESRIREALRQYAETQQTDEATRSAPQLRGELTKISTAIDALTTLVDDLSLPAEWLLERHPALYKPHALESILQDARQAATNAIEMLKVEARGAPAQQTFKRLVCKVARVFDEHTAAKGARAVRRAKFVFAVLRGERIVSVTDETRIIEILRVNYRVTSGGKKASS